MKKLNLDDYKRNRVDKLDCMTTGINLERRHKEFLDANAINLSALVRDFLDSVIKDAEKLESKDNEKA